MSGCGEVVLQEEEDETVCSNVPPEVAERVSRLLRWLLNK